MYYFDIFKRQQGHGVDISNLTWLESQVNAYLQKN